MRRLLFCALGAALVAVPLASGSAVRASKYPSSIVVLGTSTAAGWQSDPAHPWQQARQNSWATGTNPAVKSIYARILAVNPAIKGHNPNLVEGADALELAGHELDSFARQVHKIRLLKVKPELVLVQVIDRAVKCDGTTERNFTDYGARFSASLQALAKTLPNARIFVISQWGSMASYVKFLKGLELGKRLKNAGKKPCQLVESPSGRVVPERVAYTKSIVAGQEAQLRASCAKVANCRYDGGAAQRIVLTPADLADFQFTPTIQGQAKIAAAEWKALAGFVNKP